MKNYKPTILSLLLLSSTGVTYINAAVSTDGITPPGGTGNPQTILYKDASASTDERVEDLLRRMTTEEKIMQLSQYTLGTNNNANNVGEEVENIPAEIGSLIYFGTEPELRNRMQRHAIEDSRLGIPVLFGHDVIHGFRTIFPIPLAQACTWNPEAVSRSCAVDRKSVV